VAITIRCQCGKSLVVKEELVGKRARCPHCKEILTIPDLKAGAEPKAQEHETYAMAAAPPSTTPKAPAAANPGALAGACPSCAHALSAGAVLCINCGFDLRRGKRVAKDEAAPSPGKPTRCLHCNAEIEEGSPLCGTCGKAVGSKPKRRVSDSPSKPSRDWLLFGIAFVVTLVLVFVMFPLNLYLFWQPGALIVSAVVIWLTAVMAAVNWTFRMFGEDMPDFQQGLATVTLLPATVMFFGTIFFAPCLLVLFGPLLLASVAKEMGYLVDMGFVRGILIVIVYNVLAVVLTGVGMLVLPAAVAVFGEWPTAP